MISSGELTKPEHGNQPGRHREIKPEELVFASKPQRNLKRGKSGTNKSVVVSQALLLRRPKRAQTFGGGYNECC